MLHRASPSQVNPEKWYPVASQPSETEVVIDIIIITLMGLSPIDLKYSFFNHGQRIGQLQMTALYS